MSYTPKVYRAQGGDLLVVESGGKVQIKTGGQIVGDRRAKPTFFTPCTRWNVVLAST
jgi:hypothetical protein